MTINVSQFARADGVTDDTAAVLRAAAVAAATAIPTTLYFPAGTYRIRQPVPMFQGLPVSIRGDGPKSIILVDPLFGAGDVFSWSEVWNANTFGNSSLVNGPGLQSGVTVEGIHISGVLGGKVQNGLAFYDRTDFLTIRDVTCSYLTGRALYCGSPKNQPISYIRESRLRGFRASYCGSNGVPSVEFTSTNTTANSGDASNEISVDSMDIFAPGGPGLVIRNANAAVGARNMKFDKLRIEGLQNAGYVGDLLQIGDASFLGNVNNLQFGLLELIDPYPGSLALRVTAPTGPLAPYQCAFAGFIGGGSPNGGGIRIDAGRLLFFSLTGINTKQTNVTIGPAPLTASPLVFDGFTQETSWTWNVDPSATGFVYSPNRTQAVP